MFKEVLICVECETVNDKDAKFCKNCGCSKDSAKVTTPTYPVGVRHPFMTPITTSKFDLCPNCGQMMMDNWCIKCSTNHGGKKDDVYSNEKLNWLKKKPAEIIEVRYKG